MKSRSLVELYKALSVADSLLAKGMAISELSQIANIETRLREFLITHWREMSDHLASVASGYSDVEKILELSDDMFAGWQKDVDEATFTELSKAYKLAKTVGAKKAQGLIAEPLTFDPPSEEVEKAKKPKSPAVTVNFGATDRAAQEALRRDQVYWTGNLYDSSVRDRIRTTAEEVIQSGASRSEAGKMMKERLKAVLNNIVIPTGWTGTAKNYFEMLAANAITTARAQGQIRAFEENEVEKFVISNPMDERTCPVCSHMNGKVFYVRDGVRHTSSVVAATDPSSVKAIHPWLHSNALRAISQKAGFARGPGGKDAKALVASGFFMPPFHARCRCAVDIAD